MLRAQFIRIFRDQGHRVARLGDVARGAIFAGLASLGTGFAANVAVAAEKGPVSGLPLPRFVSLKADEVNLRSGPGRDYPTQWVYRRAGLPLEVIKEFDTWREVRDADGVSGWISHALLSGRRTALILPWEVKAEGPAVNITLRQSDSERARATALVEAGVIASVHSCDSRWCHVTVDDVRGYIEQNKLWGVYEGEIVK